MKFALAIFLPLSLFLFGCETMMLKSECEKTNWEAVGYQEGLNGRMAEMDVGGRVQKCAEVERPANLAAYRNGRQAGLAQYCTPEIAGQRGSSAQIYKDELCPAANRATLTQRHEAAVREFCKSGYQAGARGIQPEVSCPKDLETSFLLNFQSGKTDLLNKRVAELEGQVKNLGQDVQNLRYENQRLKSKNSDLEREVSDLETKLRHQH